MRNVDKLPTDWEEATVKELCGQPQYGHTESATHESVGPKFLRITDIQEGDVNWESVPYCPCDSPAKYRLADGDILFARTGATTGKSYLVHNPPNAVFASYLIRIRPGTRVLPEYVWWYFQSSGYWASVFGGIDDGNRPNMNGSKLAALRIPFPKSKTEQRRLVARIEALTSRLEQARNARRAAVAESDNLLTIAQRSEYERLLVDEETTPLGEIGEVISGGTPAKSVEAYWGGDVPWIAPKEMKRFRIGESSMNVTQHAVDAGAAKLVRKPAVLMVVRGMILAKRVPIAVSTRPLTINQDMKAFIPPDGLDASFLGHMLCGAAEELQTRVEVAGHGTCKLETPAWSPLPIPVPSPAEQRRIVARLEVLAAKQSELRRLQTETEAELTAFTPALLAKAFRGEF